MSTLTKILTIFLFQSLQPLPSYQLSKKCFDIFNNFLHPHYCCLYPVADTRKTTADHCYHSCFLDPDICCLYDCIYREMHYYNNGKFTVEDRIQYYNVDIEDKKISKEKWEPVIQQVVESCETNVPIKIRDNEPCKMPEYMYSMFLCEHMEMFLKCPTFQNTTYCLELQQFVQNTTDCVINYEGKNYLQQEFWFINEIFEEGDNFECIVWQMW